MPSESVARNENSKPEQLRDQHPGFTRFYDEIRRNHPEISDQEIASLFKAWSR
jgi:hypothetical protein